MFSSTKLLLLAAVLTILLGQIFSEAGTSTIYTGKAKTLVLIDDWHITETHSLFFQQVKGNNRNNIIFF